MFRRLQTKLTVLYAGMFGLALALVAMAVYLAISGNAQSVIKGELQASGTVFDRVWDLRSRELKHGAELLSRDFGFREALATRDQATISSAVTNLQARLGADLALVIDIDGSAVAADPRSAAAAAALRPLVEQQDDPSGVIIIDGHAYEAITVPILSPTPIGWMVFASELDAGEMKALEQLSAIPLDATVMHRSAKAWAGDPDPTVGAFVTKAMKEKIVAPRILKTRDGQSVALVKSLESMDPAAPAVLVLRYPLARALAPYRPLLAMVAGMMALGLVLVVAGSWQLSRSLTRPISALEEAAHRLQRGEEAHVVAETNDEIGRLADSFNVMAAEIRDRERRIIHLALHDPDTDLLSRLGLEREIAERGGGSAGRVLVVVAIGVDRFVEMRGAIGYALTSAMMGEVGGRLAMQNPDCRVARLGSDALGILFEADTVAAAQRRAAQLQADNEAPLRLSDNTVDVSLSAGLAALGVHADSPAELIERASIALDQARAAHQKSAVFDREVYGDPAANLSLMSEMRRGVTEGHMFLHYQPKLDLRRGVVTGVEALVRWNHPDRGMLPPDTFIGMAEETGHISALTDWVLDQAVADQARLDGLGHSLQMAVNISGRLLGDLDFAEEAVRRTAKATGPVCFEITETAVIANPDMALRIFERFAAAGLSISIDDYGAGLSSLAYLKQIPADELKIDKAFVLSMDQSQRDRLLVRSTIDLAHSLGLKVTAEGVETATAQALLAGMGCDLAQGFGIARPMPLAKLVDYLAVTPMSQSSPVRAQRG